MGMCILLNHFIDAHPELFMTLTKDSCECLGDSHISITLPKHKLPFLETLPSESHETNLRNPQDFNLAHITRNKSRISFLHNVVRTEEVPPLPLPSTLTSNPARNLHRAPVIPLPPPGCTHSSLQQLDEHFHSPQAPTPNSPQPQPQPQPQP
jgi:hypothetical protein